MEALGAAAAIFTLFDAGLRVFKFAHEVKDAKDDQARQVNILIHLQYRYEYWGEQWRMARESRSPSEELNKFIGGSRAMAEGIDHALVGIIGILFNEEDRAMYKLEFNSKIYVHVVREYLHRISRKPDC
jgi:hypothetical protein